MATVDKRRILGEEKFPLEIIRSKEKDKEQEKGGPQIGLVPKILDTILEQDSLSLIYRKGNVQMLAPNAKGFLRVAVENRTAFLADSLLSALAPYFLRNNAFELKQRILDVITARVFIQMNYGNLLLEFYDPKRLVPKDKNRLNLWANTNLGVELNGSNDLEIERIFNSYNNFTSWLQDETTKKEYRQFSMILAQANLIQGKPGRAGTSIILFDIHKDNTVSIRCPSYGYNNELMDNNDIIFMLHHYSGIFEPLFFVDNTVSEGIRDRDLYTLVFQKGRYNGWPDIVKKLYGEFRRSCSGPGKTIYTSQSYIKSDALIPLSYAQRILLNISQKFNNFFFRGILRDAYNHISAIICEERQDDGTTYQIALPVIDDGILITDKELVVNWSDFNMAPLNETINIYKKYLLPFISSRYPGYNLLKYVVSKKSDTLVGIQLRNLVFIPVEEEDVPNTINKEQIIMIDEFEFDINRDIILKKIDNYKDVESKFLSEEDLEEIYQHLRISFANYLSGEKGSDIKERLEDDILSNRKLTLNDKRKRMMVLFGTEIQSWLSNEKTESTFSFIRNDCTVQSKEMCQGYCVWTSENKCKLHVPEKKDYNVGILLIARLMDEILRFTEKRRELFENDLVRLVFFKKPIRIGDQYIVPENTLEWSDILRVIWSDSISEKPKFFEEISNMEEFKTRKSSSYPSPLSTCSQF